MTKLFSWMQLLWVAGVFGWVGVHGLGTDVNNAFLLGLSTGYSFIDGAFGILTGKSPIMSALRYASHAVEKSKQP